MKKLKLCYPVAVEGKYDKIKLSAVVESPIFVLNGFSFFKNKENQAVFRLYAKNGVIILTDSDSAGNFIRSRLKQYTDCPVISLYTPQIEGKERRKSCPSKAGFLGVEGISADVLRDLLAPYESTAPTNRYMTKQRLYSDGLMGKENSVALRNKLLCALGLPENLTTSAICDCLNSAVDESDYISALEKARSEQQ